MKYQRFAISGCKDIKMRRFYFLTKTQFLFEKKCTNFFKKIRSFFLKNRTISTIFEKIPTIRINVCPC